MFLQDVQVAHAPAQRPTPERRDPRPRVTSVPDVMLGWCQWFLGELGNSWVTSTFTTQLNKNYANRISWQESRKGCYFFYVPKQFFFARQNNGHLASWMAGTERELREMKWLLNSSAARLDGQHRRGGKFSSFFNAFLKSVGRWIESRLNNVNLCGKIWNWVWRKSWGWRVNLIAPTILLESYHIWFFDGFFCEFEMKRLRDIAHIACLDVSLQQPTAMHLGDHHFAATSTLERKTRKKGRSSHKTHKTSKQRTKTARRFSLKTS